LGKEARSSMKQFSNKLLIKKWIKLILAVYKGEQYYNKLREEYKKISQTIGMNILNNQLKLLKMRYDAFKGITMNEFENFSYIYNYH
jgi:DNA-binding HxlR family transcriptional regulator